MRERWVIFKLLRNGVLLLLGIGLVVSVAWLSLPLMWYPSYDEMDLEKITREADVLLARCEENNIGPDSSVNSMLIEDFHTPYIYSLVGDDETHQCDEGVRLVLWTDYWMTTSGLYVVGQQQEIPAWLLSNAFHLGGRVYKWHDNG